MMILSENFWNSIKPNIDYLYEVEDWWKICIESFVYDYKEEDKEFIDSARGLLPEDTDRDDSWSEWIGKIKENTDRKGKELFMPLRLALTGKENGPELAKILPLINRDEIVKRLS